MMRPPRRNFFEAVPRQFRARAISEKSEEGTLNVTPNQNADHYSHPATRHRAPAARIAQRLVQTMWRGGHGFNAGGPQRGINDEPSRLGRTVAFQQCASSRFGGKRTHLRQLFIRLHHSKGNFSRRRTTMKYSRQGEAKEAVSGKRLIGDLFLPRCAERFICSLAVVLLLSLSAEAATFLVTNT